MHSNTDLKIKLFFKNICEIFSSQCTRDVINSYITVVIN